MCSKTNASEYVMRIYPRGKDGFVDRGGKYITELVDPAQPFPEGTFRMDYDYAIEDQNGNLKFLKAVRVYNKKEYCEFSGQDVYEKRGTVIWRR